MRAALVLAALLALPLAAAAAHTSSDASGDSTVALALGQGSRIPLSACHDTARDITSVTSESLNGNLRLALHVTNAAGGLSCGGSPTVPLRLVASTTQMRLAAPSPPPGRVYVFQVSTYRGADGTPTSCYYVSWNDPYAYPAEWCKTNDLDPTEPSLVFPLTGTLVTLNGASHAYDLRGVPYVVTAEATADQDSGIEQANALHFESSDTLVDAAGTIL